MNMKKMVTFPVGPCSLAKVLLDLYNFKFEQLGPYRFKVVSPSIHINNLDIKVAHENSHGYF